MTLIKSLDLGIGPRFLISKSKLEVVVNTAIAKSRAEADFEFSIAYGSADAWNEIVDTESLLHLAGHGAPNGRIGGAFFRQLSAQDFAEFVEESESEIFLDALIVDACETFTSDWFKLIRRSIPAGHKMIYIGTSDKVPWDHAEIYAQVFFSELLSSKYPTSCSARRERVKQAHKIAVAAESWLFEEPSYFHLKEIVGQTKF